MRGRVHGHGEPGLRGVAGRSLAAGALLCGGLSACGAHRDHGVHDLTRALAFVEAVHPAPATLDLVAARAAIAAEAARRDPGRPPSPAERLRGAAAVAGAVGDAHIVAGAPPRPIAGLVPVLPVEIDGEVYVDAFVHPVPVGTRLRAIDGRPAAAWLDALGAFASVDGGRADVRRAAAARHFAAWAHRAHGPQDTWEITTESPEGALQTWTVPGLSLDAARALDAGRRSASGRGAPVADPGLAWLSGPPGTAVLRLARFATRDVESWERVLDQGFASLRGDEALILDLRGNAGGYRDLGLAVARRVIGEAPPQWTAMTVRVRSIPLRFRRGVSFLAAPARALRRFPGAPVAGGWRQVGDPLAAAMRANLASVAPHRGPVVAFVDDATSSAAVELAVSVRAARPALRVVGTPTAGACDRHTGEIPVTYPLGDGVVWLVSLAELTLVPAPGCRAGDGLPIDVPVVLRREDWAAGRDPWWEAVAATGGGPAAPREGGVAGETVVSPAPN